MQLIDSLRITVVTWVLCGMKEEEQENKYSFKEEEGNAQQTGLICHQTASINGALLYIFFILAGSIDRCKYFAGAEIILDYTVSSAGQ